MGGTAPLAVAVAPAAAAEEEEDAAAEEARPLTLKERMAKLGGGVPLPGLPPPRGVPMPGMGHRPPPAHGDGSAAPVVVADPLEHATLGRATARPRAAATRAKFQADDGE